MKMCMGVFSQHTGDCFTSKGSICSSRNEEKGWVLCIKPGVIELYYLTYWVDLPYVSLNPLDMCTPGSHGRHCRAEWRDFWVMIIQSLNVVFCTGITHIFLFFHTSDVRGYCGSTSLANFARATSADLTFREMRTCSWASCGGPPTAYQITLPFLHESFRMLFLWLKVSTKSSCLEQLLWLTAIHPGQLHRLFTRARLWVAFHLARVRGKR